MNEDDPPLSIFLNGVRQEQGGLIDYESGEIDISWDAFRSVGEPILASYERRHPTERFVEELDAADRAEESGAPVN